MNYLDLVKELQVLTTEDKIVRLRTLSYDQLADFIKVAEAQPIIKELAEYGNKLYAR